MSDDHALGERIAFIGLDDKARGTLRSLAPLLRREIKTALGVFYDKLRQTPQTRRFFRDEAHISSASSRQERHWDVITQADFGAAYATAVRTVGQTHARLGLEPRWYIGGYAIMADRLFRAVIADKWPKGLMGKAKGAEHAGDAVSSLMKAIMLDMDIAISTYLEALEVERNGLEASRKAAEANQAAAVAGIGEALSKLAHGDLASRMAKDVSPEFQKLKDDFNAAVTALEKAMVAVTENTDALGVGADEIGAAADDLSRRTETQAASLEQTAAALDEITSTVKRTASGSKQATQAVAGARTEAEKSGAVVGQTISAMAEIETSAREISQIIGVIDEIAFQTNLLALNAGVEAARAGDAGKGFAVVASEVRALAQRSAEAAKEIKALISASSSQVENGVHLVDQTGQALKGIITRIEEIDGLISDIANSAQEQSSGLQQVNTAINQMDQVTQQNAAMVEQTNAATQSLKGQAVELKRLMSTFTMGRGVAVAPAFREYRTGTR